LVAEAHHAPPSPPTGYHQRGASGVELSVELDVGAEPRRATVRDHLEHPADRVPVLPDAIDLGHHPVRHDLVEAADRRGVHHLEVLRPRQARRTHGDLADPNDVGDDRDPELREQHLAEHAERDAHRGLARARAFEHVANVVGPYFSAPAGPR
jgi:hypothetical protein